MEELCETHPLPYKNSLQTLTELTALIRDRERAAEKAGTAAKSMEQQFQRLQEYYQICQSQIIAYKKQMDIGKRDLEEENKRLEEERKNSEQKQSQIDGLNSQLWLVNNENIQLKRAASNVEMQTIRADRLQNKLEHMTAQCRELERQNVQLKHSDQGFLRLEQEFLRLQQQDQHHRREEFLRQQELTDEKQDRRHQLPPVSMKQYPYPSHHGASHNSDHRFGYSPSPLYLNSQQQSPVKFDTTSDGGGQRKKGVEERWYVSRQQALASSQPAEHSRTTAESSSKHDSDTSSDENPLIKDIDRDMIEAQQEVHKMYDDPFEGAGSDDSFEIPFDPNLICPKCGRQFRRGEIQKLRKHHRDCQG